MRIGTVGTNFVVVDFVKSARAAGAEVTACYSRRRETADAFADKNGIEKRYDDRAAFLNDETLDFIYIASPNSLHFQWTIDALNAGRNVICEKPFMSNTREVEEAIRLAGQKGLFLFEAVTVPHSPNYQKLRDELPALGEIKLVQLNMSQYSSRYDAHLRGENPNIFNPAFSGGALMDLGYYVIHFAYGLFGEPLTVQYYANKADNGIDTSGTTILQYPGMICTLTACKDSRSENLNQIQGTGGYITIPGAASICAQYTVHTREGDRTENVQQPDAPSLYYEMADFKAIWEARDHKKADELLDYALRVNRVVERARRSAGILFPADQA